MPRYFFNVRSMGMTSTDAEGEVFTDLVRAKVSAQASIRCFLADQLHLGPVDPSWRIDILDEAGDLLATVPFRVALAGSRLGVAPRHRKPGRYARYQRKPAITDQA